ncbi:MAG TPA: exosortase W [Dissulfurispiraceae bacterium]
MMNNNTDQQELPCNAVLPFHVWVKTGLLALGLALAYSEAVSLLVRSWLTRDDYSHGFIVPFASLYFIYAGRERLRSLPVQPEMHRGLALLTAGSLMLLLGNAGSAPILQQVSLIIVIPGLVLMLWGTKRLKALALPLGYLLLMFPSVLDIVINRIHWPFQLFTSVVAAKLLHLLGIPVFRTVQFLELPGITLEVANACSGVRYLVSIIAIGVPLAFFTQKTLLKRIVLVAGAVGVGILANPVRVTLIGLWVYYGGKGTHGPLHILQGLFVSGIGIAFLFAVAWVLAEKTSSNGPALPPYRGDTRERLAGQRTRFSRTLTAAAMLFLALGSFIRLHTPLPVPLERSLAGVPSAVGGWHAVEAAGEGPLEIRGADSELARVYRDAAGREIKFQAGYFEYQGPDKRLAQCTLQGLYEKSREVELRMEGRAPVRINAALIGDGPQKSLLLYWYHLDGRIVADRYKARLVTAVDALLRRKTNGAIAAVAVPYSGDMQRAMDSGAEFSKRIIPVLSDYLP